MMRHLWILVGFSVIAACSQEPAKQDKSEAVSSAEVAGADQGQDIKKEVESLVRTFSGDPGAAVTISSQDDSIVCGTATINGEDKKFYADLVDGEAFIETGIPAIDEVIATAC